MTCRNCSGVSRVAGTAVPMPGVVDEYVDPAELVHRRVDQRLARLGGGDIGLHGDGAAAGALHERGGVREPVDTPGAEDDVGAGLGERLGEGDAESGGGAGDDRHLAVEARTGR